MRIDTLTVENFGLLHALRDAVDSSDNTLMCVAFAHERGVRLLGDELRRAGGRGGQTRLLVTSVFDHGGTTHDALKAANDLGVQVRIHNHSGGTYHPKLYLTERKAHVQAVVGSANLTGGLACNVEVAVRLAGARDDEPVMRAWRIGEDLWSHARSIDWDPAVVAGPTEGIDPELMKFLRAAVRADPVFLTLSKAQPNHVCDLSDAGALVETTESQKKGLRPQLVEAWMLNLAWEFLRTRGTLTNAHLLNELRVHRSSAVCALLARLPGVQVVSMRPIELRWAGASR